MKIGIDARLYGTHQAGIGRYVKELILNLLKIDRENQYIFFVYNNKAKQEIKRDLENCLSKRPEESPSRSKSLASRQITFVLTPYRWYSLKEQLLLPRAIKKANIDLLHFPHFNVPLFYTRPPFIVTIHDLIIHHFPDERATTLPKWLYRVKLWGYKKVIKHAVRKAGVVITPSEFTKKDILGFYNIDANKLKVVYEGITNLKSETRNTKFKTNSKFQIPNSKFLLYVGSAYPHKNLEGLIDALAILRQKYKFDGKLVLVGKIDYFYNQLQKHLISRYRDSQYLISNIIFFGYASDVELAELYANAKLFIFPSLQEGFGLPPLEAMSLGVPVVASDAASIPEICGDAALYFDPNDTDDLAAKIHSVITSKTKQSELRQKGYEQIKKYSWAEMAGETLEIYKAV